MNYGFVKVAAAVPHVKVADCKFNVERIESLIAVAEGKGVQIIIFPEMSITGYTCGDLFGQQLLLEEAEMGLMQILNNTRQLDIISIVGMPVVVNSTVINSAVVIQKGKVLGVTAKTYLPNYKEFYEQRWFTSAIQLTTDNVRLCGQIVPIGANLLFETSDTTFGIEICEDLWSTIPPSSSLALQGAEILFNMSADNEGIGKHNYLCSLISQQSARCIAGYVFSSCGFGESTTDVVFAGNGLIYENGSLLARSERFSMEEQLIISEIDVERIRAERRINTTFAANQANLRDKRAVSVATEFVNSKELALTRSFHPHPFVPQGKELNEHCEANNGFIINLIESILIVIVIIMLVMGLRAGVLIGSSLIFSIGGTLLIMSFFGVGLNRTSLAGFIIAMGMLVDNAIVVTDNAQIAIARGVIEERP